MMNRSILIGRLTKDPELRYTPSGVAVTQFTLAVDRPFTNGQGQREADFINIVTWRKLAETCANYLRKGRLTAVEGRIQVRNYENNEGRRVYVTEIVADNVRFLESANSQRDDQHNQDPGMPVEPTRKPMNQDPFSDDSKPIDISDDDLPF
ncbi:single-stranded DNA-binding protein [Chengkuizengella sp. SCS-71B]|uniref:single-stranded DNA-binding protein n=1 Tax=Chengkuizengella sp. SCS-71B TaxID=3115290 RepID=UPI0032C21F7D